MTHKHRVAVLVGSLRRESYNRKLATAFSAIASDMLSCDFVPIDGLTLFNQDEEETPPASWQSFWSRIRPAQAVLFVTPEYNRSIPGILKNAIDIGSRPRGHSVWTGKPGAIITVSPNKTGGFGANHHLRQVMTSLDVPMLQHPEAYIGECERLFNAGGDLVDDKAQKLLREFASAFAVWIDKISGAGRLK